MLRILYANVNAQFSNFLPIDSFSTYCHARMNQQMTGAVILLLRNCILYCALYMRMFTPYVCTFYLLPGFLPIVNHECFLL